MASCGRATREAPVRAEPHPTRTGFPHSLPIVLGLPLNTWRISLGVRVCKNSNFDVFARHSQQCSCRTQKSPRLSRVLVDVVDFFASNQSEDEDDQAIGASSNNRPRRRGRPRRRILRPSTERGRRRGRGRWVVPRPRCLCFRHHPCIPRPRPNELPTLMLLDGMGDPADGPS
jgi:hypothetical protein